MKVKLEEPAQTLARRPRSEAGGFEPSLPGAVPGRASNIN